VKKGKGELDEGAQHEAGSAGAGLTPAFHITRGARGEPEQATQIFFSI